MTQSLAHSPGETELFNGPDETVGLDAPPGNRAVQAPACSLAARQFVLSNHRCLYGACRAQHHLTGRLTLGLVFAKNAHVTCHVNKVLDNGHNVVAKMKMTMVVMTMIQ